MHISVGLFMGFPDGSVVKNLPANAEFLGSVPGSRRSPGEGNGLPLQYSCLGNLTERGACWATVHGMRLFCDFFSFLIEWQILTTGQQFTCIQFWIKLHFTLFLKGYHIEAPSLTRLLVSLKSAPENDQRQKQRSICGCRE